MSQYCGALFWYAERIAKYRNGKKPIFSMCCQEGKITLELLHPPPQFLANLLQYKGSQESVNFRKNIRTYNSMFAFTSIGAKVDNEVNKKPGPYVFKISGQNYHRMGSLLPTDGQRPKFAQLYIYDTENEIDNRMRAFNSSDEIKNINRNIVRSLLEMFDCVNEIVKAFRMVRDRFRIDDYLPISLRLIGDRAENRPQYNPPSCSEIAGLIVGDLGVADRHRDIVVEHKTDGLKRISELHPSFMAMQYPILFPYGEDGFRIGIEYNGSSRRKIGSRKNVTMREFYAYRIQNRLDEGITLISGGKLFQQYLVDAFSCVEEERLDYIRRNQSDLRVELYKGIKDAIVAGDVDGDAVGKKIILPSSFTAGPRYMIQNYQDAIAICRQCGHPDLFITFTCNPQWLEIQNALQFIPGQKAEDRPDIVSRVFKMKLEALMADIKNGTYFGKIVADNKKMGYIALKELTLAQQHAKIKVRISRIWESTMPQLKKDILSLDCLLIDEEGYAMQATIRKHDADTFRALLAEGSAYIIENFNVLPSRNSYKVVDRKYTVQISKWTRINTKYTCKAQLLTINTDFGWWYKACYDCKGAVKDYDDNFWCGQCGKNDQPPVPWYKLNAVVDDGTGSTNFTIFGKAAQDLIRLPAHQLATASNSSKFVLPSAIKNILGRTYIFQISSDSRKVSLGPQTFRVTKIFMLSLDTKRKTRQLRKSTKDSADESPDSTTPSECHDDILDEMSLDSTVQSL
uniref:Uncharacterized protein n=1 Tax=Ananas comosus var. bracteatus TaxID=296719 RepID=A0A6V7PN27_ANACO|nr:unnamed protein product [Ananas comosus var. bracteatus]